MYCRLETSDGSGSKNFDPGRVKFLLLGLGRVSHFWFGYRFGKFPLKCQMFQFFALWVKKNLIRSGGKVPGSELGQPIIYCGSKVCSVWFGSGQCPSLLETTYWLAIYLLCPYALYICKMAVRYFFLCKKYPST